MGCAEEGAEGGAYEGEGFGVEEVLGEGWTGGRSPFVGVVRFV